MDLLSMCSAIGARARESFASGKASFALPEAAPVATLIAERAPSSELRDEARAWLASGASYHEGIRLCARAVEAFDALHAPAPDVYCSKVAGELDAALELWPHVLVFPACKELSARELVELRAFPLFPLGVTTQRAWVDGRRSSPSEFFFHDLDHARFKVRESLHERGIDVADAYRDGTTFDVESGRHRSILPLVRGKLGSELWHEADTARAFGARVLDRIDRMDDRVLARACELLLFEIVHEKSFPLSPRALARELGSKAHLDKLRGKQAAGYFGDSDPGASVIARLPDARTRLQQELG